MAIETDTITLPSYWANAIINGNYSGMDSRDVYACDYALDKLAESGWRVVACDSDTERFTWSYRLYDVVADCSGGSVMDYIIHKVD